MMGQQTKGVEVLEDWRMIPVTEVMDIRNLLKGSDTGCNSNERSL